MIQITITPEDIGHIELLAALIGSLEVDGIELKDECFVAYTTDSVWESPGFRESLEAQSELLPFGYTVEVLPEINWNAEWEKHFDPVFIEDFLTIRASFHDLQPVTAHTITINPKMSFGTGHHATTWMMAKSMALLDFKGTAVLDAGSGTGVLAILAAILGADRVLAFDNDPWCYENALENAELNGQDKVVEVREGGLEVLTDERYDVVLANINKNFHLDHADALAAQTKPGGLLVISGFYDVDSRALLDRYLELHLVAQYLLIKDRWACIVFRRME